MAKKTQEKNPPEGLQLWKVVSVFALVFTAVQLAGAAFDVGIKFIMDQLNATAMRNPGRGLLAAAPMFAV